MTVITVSSLIIVAIIAIVAFAFPDSRWLRWLEPFHQRLSGFAEHQRTSVLTVALLSFLLNSAFGLLIHFPVPAVHDEFAYLLTADTFAQGRLTNPTHEHWEHFESYYLIHHPSYQAKYPPAQGWFLALGQFLTGSPIIGVWLSMGLAAGALTWMLQGWTTPKWALAGGLAFTFNADIMMNWGQTYWGGAIAFLGSAMMFGAVIRLVKKTHISSAICLSIGVSILANSRPYEGFLAALPVALLLLTRWIIQKRWRESRFWLKEVLPITLILVMFGFWMASYNKAVTGHASRMPYMQWLKKIAGEDANVSTIAVSKIDPQRRMYIIHPMNPDDPEVAEHALAAKNKIRDARKGWDFTISKLKLQYTFFVKLLWTLSLCMAPLVIRTGWGKFAVFELLFVLCAISLNTAGGFPHYFAPVAPLAFYVIAAGMHQLELVETQTSSLKVFAKLAIVVMPVIFIGDILETWTNPPYIADNRWALERQKLIRELEQQPGKDIVFVRYLKGHLIDQEWVYNSANIDQQSVIWARDFGTEKNAELLKHFNWDSVAWQLTVLHDDFQLTPYKVD